MQSLGYRVQLISQANLTQDIHPMGGVRAKPLFSPDVGLHVKKRMKQRTSVVVAEINIRSFDDEVMIQMNAVLCFSLSLVIVVKTSSHLISSLYASSLFCIPW